MKFNKYIKKNSPLILTILGSVGFVATVALTIKATKETSEKVVEAEYAKMAEGEVGELTPKEKGKILVKTYAPAVGVGAGTLCCFWGAFVLSKKQQRALIAANALMRESFKAYRKELITQYGEEADKKILEGLAREQCNFHEWNLERPDEKVLWYEPISGQWFEKYEREIMDAEYHLNRNFVFRGEACFNEWLNILGVDEIEEDTGWSMKYGYFWIDFEHACCNKNGKKYYEINYIFPPEDDYGDDY